MTNEKREIRVCFEARAVSEDGKAPRIEGYAAVFDSLSENLGGFREIIKPGAFKRALSEGQDVRLLLNHDGLPLARTKSGTLKLEEDAKGLRFSADLDPTDPDVQRLMPKLTRGDVSQCSFAFETVSDSWGMVDGETRRTLLDVNLADVSVVTYPAYAATECAKRSLDQWQAQQKPAPDTSDTENLRRRVTAAEIEL